MFFVRRRFFQVASILVFLAIFFYAPGYLSADDDQELKESFTNILPEYSQLIPSIIKVNTFIRKYTAQFDGFTFGISSGFSNHSAADDEEGMVTQRMAVNIETACTKGFYPNKLDFNSGVNFLFLGNTISEDVTSLHLSYDRHLLPCLESFACINRSSNSYMGIKQRYEIGGGLKLEFEFGFRCRARKNEFKNFKYHKKVLDKKQTGTDFFKELEEKKIENFKKIGYFYKLTNDLSVLSNEKNPLEKIIKKYEKKVTKNSKNGTQAYIEFIKGIKEAFKPQKKWEKIEEENRELIEYVNEEKTKAEKKEEEITALSGELERLRRKANEIKWAFKKKYAFLGFGVLFSLMKDIETAEIDLNEGNSEAEPQIEILPPAQSYRCVIRPNITLQLSESLFFRSDCYYKFPYNFKEMKDYRINWNNQLLFKLPTNSKWANDFYLSLEYRIHYDNDPPSYDLGANNYLYARDKYSELLFNIKVVF